MIEKQIELEKKMTQTSVINYQNEIQRAKEKESFSNTQTATIILSRILDIFTNEIKKYLDEYSEGKAVKSTIAASVISRLDVETVSYITSKVIFNRIHSVIKAQALYKAIGQALEDEFKMEAYKEENKHYYESIQKDLNSRGAKANRKKNITTGVFGKRLEFHLDKWTITEKFQAGLVLLNLFINSTGLVQFEDCYKRGKHYRFVITTDNLQKWIEDINTKMEVMNPFFLPMVCPPKEWTGILDGGYISPYLKKNKLIKNNDKEYLKILESAPMEKVYESINHIQNTAWRVNTKVLDVVNKLWSEGRAVAELPDREDEPLIPYPYPHKNTKTDSYTEEEIEVIKKWKRETYEIHKRNVQKRSIRILIAQILRIANQFKDYEKIWFPYQMDFRGRLYPIPVLLQPQGSDLAKGLLTFGEGKKLDKDSVNWLKIQGANVYGKDKEGYRDRIKFIETIEEQIRLYAANPLEHREWTEADKPFQFLAFCFEYSQYLDNPDNFITHVPIQLDGTCNGLQHYSALLRDEKGGRAVNLLDSDKPSDIYGVVAQNLEEKLNELLHNGRDDISNVSNSSMFINAWLQLGINRKLTKRPVMVLPYGGTLISCREYIGEYLTDNYSPNFLWEHFNCGVSPTDCVYKASQWLSKYLWESITETIQSAIVGMDYLKKVARVVIKQKQPLEWVTPMGLLIRQAYLNRKRKRIETELYGAIITTKVNIEDKDEFDNQRQVNGICPNFIHSLDAACLMSYILKCKQAGITSIMSVHDCYGTLAPDCDNSAKFLREAFVEIYRQPILENFTQDVTCFLEEKELPELPKQGNLDIEAVLTSKYFFN